MNRLYRTLCSFGAASLLLAMMACKKSPPAAVAPASEEPHHHELNLPPVGPSVQVTFEGASREVPLSMLKNDGGVSPLRDVWSAAFPSVDPASLKFDLVGSDGFHPTMRAKCTRLLNADEISAAGIQIVSHDVSYSDTVNLPGCYHVRAVVRFDATR